MSKNIDSKNNVDSDNSPSNTDLSVIQPEAKSEIEKNLAENTGLLLEGNRTNSFQDKIKISHGEKKARKLIQSLGLKLVPGVSRVAIRKVHNVLIVVEKPEVYRNTLGDTYIVFGKLTVEDVERNIHAAAAEKFKEKSVVPEKVKKIEEEDDEDTDDEGIDEQDIDLVVTQGNVTRTQAIRSLKRNGLDIVNAIMDLTS